MITKFRIKLTHWIAPEIQKGCNKRIKELIDAKRRADYSQSKPGETK